MILKFLMYYTQGLIWDVLLPAITGLVHEAPLHPGREASTSSATQAGHLDLIQDPVHPFIQHLLCLVPVASFQGTLQPEIKGFWDHVYF